jgi:hypothetical protein
MRLGTLILATAAAIAAAGCGGPDAAPEQPEKVRLEVSAPADNAIAQEGTVNVRGRVSPAGAQVRVLGRPAQVERGTFSAIVPLEEGANVIDVAATARGRSPSMTALRVTRDERVVVPALDGVPVGDLEDELVPLGLSVDAVRGGGLFDELRSGEPAVCEQEPAAGARVERGTTVQVVVAKAC